MRAWPEAKSAEPIVSPSSAATFLPSNVNVTSASRSIRSPGLFGVAVCRLGPPLAAPALVQAAVKSTSFVRVSRSAMNHSPQPERCTHHSCCTPATFRRK